MSAGVFSASSGLGEVIGPLFGASMYESSGFRMTSDMTAMVTFFYVFVFTFVLTNGVESIRTTLITHGTDLDDKEENKLKDVDYTKENKKGKGKKYSKVIDEDAGSLGSQAISLLSQSDIYSFDK